MIKKLSVLIISKNSASVIEKTLLSVKNLVGKIIIIDNYSTDQTRQIAKKYQTEIFLHKEENLGKQKAYGLKKVKTPWILILDTDEVVSTKLAKEIKQILAKNVSSAGFYIPYQNHLFGRPLKYGGENYQMLRLFRKNAALIEKLPLHEKVIIKKGKVGRLKNKIYHYSYRSLWQIFVKFTDYAIRDYRLKCENREKSSFAKIILYPLHMFYARFIKDKGYKDGLFRIPLDLGFAYMEFLTYLLLACANLKQKFTQHK